LRHEVAGLNNGIGGHHPHTPCSTTPSITVDDTVLHAFDRLTQPLEPGMLAYLDRVRLDHASRRST